MKKKPRFIQITVKQAIMRIADFYSEDFYSEKKPSPALKWYSYWHIFIRIGNTFFFSSFRLETQQGPIGILRLITWITIDVSAIMMINLFQISYTYVVELTFSRKSQEPLLLDYISLEPRSLCCWPLIDVDYSYTRIKSAAIT